MLTAPRACYFAIIFFTAGMVLIGAAFEKHLNIAAFIVGWGLVVVAAMINITVVCKWKMRLDLRPWLTLTV